MFLDFNSNNTIKPCQLYIVIGRENSLYEMYEDIKDKEVIDDFEERDAAKETSFSTFDELFGLSDEL